MEITTRVTCSPRIFLVQISESIWKDIIETTIAKTQKGRVVDVVYLWVFGLGVGILGLLSKALDACPLDRDMYCGEIFRMDLSCEGIIGDGSLL